MTKARGSGGSSAGGDRRTGWLRLHAFIKSLRTPLLFLVPFLATLELLEYVLPGFDGFDTLGTNWQLALTALILAFTVKR